ncbi:hypothetical protein [Segniliparus rugosus]|uniref:Uncharacterized protein n=1 Tax=Segniliparus rugosus (strain ATCC BAA-974 / DSM 45345 / CCUG 50838 / CIP 108380 / JCM 13579 / CDC 945) TaxID=679197 RepID=E5XLN5_SEGRC|nr:hypothetical protein [Segniliparus rugosus]EFV14713.1 hypothetical protein HMPREF9336_00404 [Segniliparus rugosus ATCC BAA-974]
MSDIDLHPEEQNRRHAASAGSLRASADALPDIKPEGLRPEHAAILQAAIGAARTTMRAAASTHDVGARASTAFGSQEAANAQRISEA